MSEATIDPPTFAALQDVAGPEFATELIDTFLEEAPVMIADLRASFATADVERHRRAAHSLKSNAATFGALTLASMAKALEVGGLPSSGAAPLALLEAEYARVTDALRALRHG